MYDVYLGTMLCPIAPKKIDLKINNKNKTITLIDGGEVNVLKKAGLTDISFDLLLPNVRYPFAQYPKGFKTANYYLGILEKLKVSQEAFSFKVIRKFPDGKMLFNTNMKVSLEDYKPSDDAKEGFDETVSIKLKQWKDYGTKTCNIKFANSKPVATTPKKARQTDTAKNTNKNTGETEKKIGIGSRVIVNGRLYYSSYGDKPGGWRWNHEGKVLFMNPGAPYPYAIGEPNSTQTDSRLWLGWMLASAVKAI